MTPTWGEIGSVVLFFMAIVGAVGGIYWRWSSMIGKVDRDLQDFKLEASKTFATRAGVSEQMITLTKAVNDVGDRLDKRLDGMTDRLDRVIEYQHKPVRRQP